MKERVGQVWEDRESKGWATFVVVGPPTLDGEGDAEHATLVLDSTYEHPGHVVPQWEFKILVAWEREETMRRVA